MAPELKGPILFFDGECLFCSRIVDWVEGWDTQKKLKFAALQGATAKALLPKSLTEDLQAVVLWEDGAYVTHSDAAIRLLEICGGPSAVGGKAMQPIPKFIRDAVYRFISQNRRRIFGSRACRVPEPGDRRFLP